ncbi:uncharacterized protein ColSpa_02380 [Colletotrichum spaethianum]|uniref:BTB domain-containing protein n=1 Tax=Colletotrichum spaethianum TaxID=700344 RepID=A0AA37P759_9PEZI|nr:uncharacterized protein ColSpa_02380 [Colletotrichum spaethianum]GKT42199.1 hypothetical protein ColSpa_02380 [Colletotrichum spaethianum]
MSVHGRDHSNGRRSGSADGASRTLGDVMRAGPTGSPGIVVIDQTYEETKRKDDLSPSEDLWLSSADGRYNSTIIPLRVGRAPNQEVFYVHRDVLLTTDYFRKALCGDFREAEAQSMDFPEEDPAIFHFLVAFLYQRSFVPIMPAASALDVKESHRGKAQDFGYQSDSESEVSSSEASDASARSRMPALHHNHYWTPMLELRRQSREADAGPSPAAHDHPDTPMRPAVIPPHRRRRSRQPILTPPGSTPSVGTSTSANDDFMDGDRIRGEDMRTWLAIYDLSISVYACANKYLMDDFKAVIQRHCVDMLESAGSDAAQSAVLQLCSKLYAAVPESDPLLRMIFARIGFLQPMLWQRAPQHTSEFLIGHPEVAALMLRETAIRREEDLGSRALPSMERATHPHAMPVWPVGPPMHPHMRPPPPPPPPPHWNPAPFGA